MSATVKKIKKLMGKAINDYNMIKDKDRILVAVSGGQDSLSLLWALRERLKRIPIHYDLIAIHVDLGFGEKTGKRIEEFLRKNRFDYCIENTDFGPFAHSRANKENPCFLCSHLRRKILFKKAAELHCGKIAFGHQKDDFIETFFLNLFFSGSIGTMLPAQDFFGGRVTTIRPFCFLTDSVIKQYAKYMGLSEIASGCPSTISSKRMWVRTMLSDLYRVNRKVQGNIFNALQRMEKIKNGG